MNTLSISTLTAVKSQSVDWIKLELLALDTDHEKFRDIFFTS